VRAFATFDGDESLDEPADATMREVASERLEEPTVSTAASKIGLSYTINLNLPATSDVAVFDAIFRSLKEHLLK
jgi:hypothetical protein